MRHFGAKPGTTVYQIFIQPTFETVVKRITFFTKFACAVVFLETFSNHFQEVKAFEIQIAFLLVEMGDSYYEIMHQPNYLMAAFTYFAWHCAREPRKERE